MANSILCYCKPVGFPNPNGSLSRVVPSKAIKSANREVEYRKRINFRGVLIFMYFVGQ